MHTLAGEENMELSEGQWQITTTVVGDCIRCLSCFPCFCLAEDLVEELKVEESRQGVRLRQTVGHNICLSGR